MSLLSAARSHDDALLSKLSALTFGFELHILLAMNVSSPWPKTPSKTSPRIRAARSSAHQERIAPAAYSPNARARALLRGMKIAEADLKAAGGAFDLAEVQGLLHGISRQALERRVRDGSLLAVPGPGHRRRYPALQFTSDGLVPGLKAVQDALPTRNAWAALNFLVQPDDGLGGRAPIDVLREGGVDAVVSSARRVGVQAD